MERRKELIRTDDLRSYEVGDNPVKLHEKLTTFTDSPVFHM